MATLKGLPLERPHLWLRPLDPTAAADCPVSAQESRWSAQLEPALCHRYTASRAMLRRCLASLLGLAPEAIPLHSPPGAAPRLEADLGFVSLSHSGAQLLLAWSPAPIGVDLEWAGRSLRAAALARRFFPPQEAAWLLARPEPEQRSALLASWVRKEAAIKWQGSTLSADLRHWCWDEQRGRLQHLRSGVSPDSVCRQENGWLCAAVGEGVDGGIWG